jgi:chemotaxis protein methyltransferase CheR
MNLKDRFPMARPFHLILCRNVLIYQTVDAKKEILSRITEALLPGGILALGSGESLIGLSSDYETLTVEGAILYRKK